MGKRYRGIAKKMKKQHLGDIDINQLSQDANNNLNDTIDTNLTNNINSNMQNTNITNTVENKSAENITTTQKNQIKDIYKTLHEKSFEEISVYADIKFKNNINNDDFIEDFLRELDSKMLNRGSRRSFYHMCNLQIIGNIAFLYVNNTNIIDLNTKDKILKILTDWKNFQTKS
jgi:hypothetical protein